MKSHRRMNPSLSVGQIRDQAASFKTFFGNTERTHSCILIVHLDRADDRQTCVRNTFEHFWPGGGQDMKTFLRHKCPHISNEAVIFGRCITLVATGHMNAIVDVDDFVMDRSIHKEIILLSPDTDESLKGTALCHPTDVFRLRRQGCSAYGRQSQFIEDIENTFLLVHTGTKNEIIDAPRFSLTGGLDDRIGPLRINRTR